MNSERQDATELKAMLDCNETLFNHAVMLRKLEGTVSNVIFADQKALLMLLKQLDKAFTVEEVFLAVVLWSLLMTRLCLRMQLYS